MKITIKDIEQITEELTRLRSEERPKLMQELKAARELGDLSENETYCALRERLTELEERAAELEETLALMAASPVTDVLQ